jgi:hypothetical protein
LGAGLTIQPRKKVIVKNPRKGEARARIGLYSHMMMMMMMMMMNQLNISLGLMVDDSFVYSNRP